MEGKTGAHDALDDIIDTAAESLEDERDAAAQDAPGDGTGDEASRLRDELAALNDRHLRLAAEFDNYRKRTERERAETWARSQADLAAGLLDVLDDFGRVVEVDPATASAVSVLEGVHLVARKLQRTLEAAGLEEVEAEGMPFDPESMDALMTVETDSPEQDDTVAAVFQKGYRFKGQLLRPARVQVRKFAG